VSGSGKSSLAFDTIFQEGQRRYIETLDHSLKRNIQEMTKPDAEIILGLSPTIAIEQKTILKTPRSTVGTITNIYDYLRVLFSKIAIAHCPISKEVVKPQSKEKILKSLEKLYFDKKIIILSLFIKDKKGSLKEELLEIQKKGFTKTRIDKKIYDLSDSFSLDPKKAHTIEIVIDRIQVNKDNLSRLKEAAVLALELSKGSITILDDKEEKLFTEYAYSPSSNLFYPPLKAQDFSFNHPLGMCEKCQGLALVFEFDINKIINPDLSISEDCCKIASPYNTVKYKNIYDNLARIYDFSVKTPWKNLSEKAKKIFLYGSSHKWLKMKFFHPKKKFSWTEYVNFKGVIFEAHKRLNMAKSEAYRKNMQNLMTKMLCRACKGSKIKPYPSHATINNKKIHEITALTVDEALIFFDNLQLKEEESFIAKDLILEIKKKLNFLINVGLHYLTLDRISPSLSSGELQRVKLASQIGSNLSGTTYILDEPSIGLHPYDHNKLIQTMIALKNAKNTVIVVEHDKDTIEAADTIVDIGPKAGKEGGEIIAKGKIEDIINSKRSLTGRYLSGEYKISKYKKRKISDQKQLSLLNCTCNNLKNVDLTIFLNTFTCITGVSGSGKSSLISDTLYPAVFNNLQNSNMDCGKHDKIIGIENIDKVIFTDQSPIGKTIRSNPATYTKLFDDIRCLFSQLPKSKMKGFTPSFFSFNIKEGACKYCKGLGKTKIDMDFMQDVYNTCHECKGKRFSKEILSVHYKDKNIFDILQMDIEEAFHFFNAIPHIRHKLKILNEVGLGYLQLGQSATTLSGGEAQRIKLAKELIRPPKGHTLYILDEPTTGLHFYDIEKLIKILQHLVDQHNTVIVIEHNMDLVKTADWIIDLGPKAGLDGGKILFSKTVEDMIKTTSNTAKALKKTFSKKPLRSKTKLKKAKSKKKIFAKNLVIKNASQNNLKNISLEIPHNKISIFTGPSGSGKTSLAFDTIYQEGQNRYLESLSTYSRQFFKKTKKPSVEKIENLFPPIAIEQKSHLLNPRSTIGTMTEVYDYLRILYANLGVAFCPKTNEIIKTITPDYVVNNIQQLKENTKIYILSPLNLKSNETFLDLIAKFSMLGFLKIRLNKKYYNLDDNNIAYDENLKNEIELVVDRLKISADIKPRLLEAINIASTFSDGKIIIDIDEKKDLFFNLSFASEKSGISYPEISYLTFSFNSEKGMCLDCQGLGYLYGLDIMNIIHDKKAAILDLLYIFFEEGEIDFVCQIFKNLNIDINTSLNALDKIKLNLFLNGVEKDIFYNGVSYRWKGLNATIAEMAKHSTKNIKEVLLPLMEKRVCQSCQGKRLNSLARNVKINNLSITDLCSYPIDKAYDFLNLINLDEKNFNFLSDTLNHIKKSLKFLIEIGLNYLSLDRSAPTLSSGEIQRIKLAKQLSSYLTSCIYILDEPTIGLHPHNTYLLSKALKQLKDLGNTLIIVEHDKSLIKQADYIFDFGPKAGKAGGKVLAHGTYREILNNPKSLTAEYLSKKKSIPVPLKRRDISNKSLKISNAILHNLKNISVSIPLNAITCITGVSGSGKSSLIFDIVKKAAATGIRNKQDLVDLGYAKVDGLNNFSSIISLDQNPTHQTARADVGTFSEIMPLIRQIYANLLSSKTKGLKPRHFSYNHISGMCKTCYGLGYKKINLQYLPSVIMTCDACNGYRLNPISLEISYKNKNIGQILELTIEEAKMLFEPFSRITKKLNIFSQVGLDYLTLGQELNTLSGGEMQRLRLVKELCKKRSNSTLYLFDEPTTGLHFIDIENLLKIFHKLADKKNTLIIIEHNLDLISNADYIIDIGKDAGEKGGSIIAKGTPEEIIKNKISYTAKYLKEHFYF